MGRKPGINLTTTQEKQLKRFSKETRDPRESRAAIGLLLRNDGKSAADVGNTLGVTKKQVFVWTSSFQRAGVNGLRMKIQSGRTPVKGSKAKKIIPTLLAQEPEMFGFLKGRWVVRDIAKALDEEGVHLSFQQVQKILVDMGLTLKKPKLRAPGSIKKNYRKRAEIKRYKQIAPALAKKKSQ